MEGNSLKALLGAILKVGGGCQVRAFQILAITWMLGLAGCGGKLNPAATPTPGFNLFSKEQDIQIGQQAAAQVRQQYPVVQNQFLQDYITGLGTRLASQSLAQGFPYSFTLLHAKEVNAFALPGGPTFVFSGLVLLAENEGQLAGVLAHEISHVALRHGTNQVSKQQIIQMPAALAGAAIGDSTMGQVLQVGLGVGLNGLFLRYSREDESEADSLGARIVAGAGFNPIEMAHMFEKLQAQGGPGGPEFLSDHPNPGNRIQLVQAVIQTLPRRNYNYSTGQFSRAQQAIRQLPAPPPARRAQSQ